MINVWGRLFRCLLRPLHLLLVPRDSTQSLKIQSIPHPLPDSYFLNSCVTQWKRTFRTPWPIVQLNLIHTKQHHYRQATHSINSIYLWNKYIIIRCEWPREVYSQNIKFQWKLGISPSHRKLWWQRGSHETLIRRRDRFVKVLQKKVNTFFGGGGVTCIRNCFSKMYL